ncbi:hypothetical protein B0T17DRAFT_539368, partial [Bombardia bombarda]
PGSFDPSTGTHSTVTTTTTAITTRQKLRGAHSSQCSMSLGARLWRGRPHTRGGPRGRLPTIVPRENELQTITITSTCLLSTSTCTHSTTQDARANANANANATIFAFNALEGRQSAPGTVRQGRHSSSTASSSSPMPPIPPPSQQISRMAQLPVRRHGPQEPIVVKAFTKYDNIRETVRGKNKAHTILSAQAQQTEWRIKRGLAPPDWRIILQNLIESTPVHMRQPVRIDLDGGLTLPFIHKFVESLWEIRYRTGCDMQVVRGESFVVGEGNRQREYDHHVFLFGDKTVVEGVLREILTHLEMFTLVTNVDETKTVPSLQPIFPPQDPEHIPDLNTLLLREDSPFEEEGLLLSWRGPLFRRIYKTKLRAKDIPRPNKWTTDSFEEYVRALTLSRMEPSLESKLYRHPGDHRRAVIEQLLLRFSDPATGLAVTGTAWKMALKFIVNDDVLNRKDARLLNDIMVKNGYKMTTEIYNIMAESAYRTKDLNTFQQVLRHMTDAGLRPNAKTWLRFLRIVEAEEIKRYILHAMDAKNFFIWPRLVRKVAKEVAEHDIYRAISLKQSFHDFLASQDRLYGPIWLSNYSGNRILDVLGRYNKVEDMKALAKIMFSSRDAQPDIITLNTCLTHCHLHNQLDEAVNFIRLFEDSGWRYFDDKVTMGLISEGAWKTRKPHMASVIWRYANLVNATTSRMRSRVEMLLGNKTPGKLTSRLTRLSAPGTTTTSEAAMKDFVDELFLCEYNRAWANGEAKPDQDVWNSGQMVNLMIKWYRTMHVQYKPGVRLSSLLRKALDLDQQNHADCRAGKNIVTAPIKIPIASHDDDDAPPPPLSERAFDSIFTDPGASCTLNSSSG